MEAIPLEAADNPPAAQYLWVFPVHGSHRISVSAERWYQSNPPILPESPEQIGPLFKWSAQTTSRWAAVVSTAFSLPW